MRMWRFAAGVVMLLSGVLVAPGVHGQAPPDWKTTPWVEAQDTTMATFAPDEYAWRLFLALNWPAVASGCGPDKAKKLGDPGPRVWERWALKTNVFLAAGAQPVDWAGQCALSTGAKVLTPTALDAAVQGVEQKKARDKGLVSPQFVPPGGPTSTAADEEVRMNEETFQFIRDNKLYSRAELKALAASGKTAIDFPRPAKEVKAHWVLLTDAADHSRYYTGTVGGKTYGLVGFSITSKDLPRWFWATFEHVDNETRWPALHPTFFAGWKELPPRDAYACAGKAITCGEAPKGLGLEGTVWANYRLKATQTDWVDSFGEPTLVVNSKIEGTFVQTKSSCISCHALAFAGSKASFSVPFELEDIRVPPDPSQRAISFIGVVDKEDRLPTGTPDPTEKFMQLDFVWSLRNAK